MRERYERDGRRYFGVTSILGATNCQDRRFFTIEAAERGTGVHACCTAIDDGLADEAPDDPEFEPYTRAYLDFLSVMQPEWIFVEHAVFDPVLGYAGTLDRAGVVQGQRVICEIKTGSIPPWACLQLAAYRRLLPDPTSWRRYVLLLVPTGRWAWIEQTDPQDERVFLSALTIFHWQQAHVLAGVA